LNYGHCLVNTNRFSIDIAYFMVGGRTRFSVLWCGACFGAGVRLYLLFLLRVIYFGYDYYGGFPKALTAYAFEILAEAKIRRFFDKKRARCLRRFVFPDFGR
jgi:hypothetical protein